MTLISRFQQLLISNGIALSKHPATHFSSIDIQSIFLNQHWIHELGSELKFVQVVANNGFNGGDPISHLYLERNWQGLLIEPQPDVFMELQSSFKDKNNLTLVN